MPSNAASFSRRLAASKRSFLSVLQTDFHLKIHYRFQSHGSCQVLSPCFEFLAVLPVHQPVPISPHYHVTAKQKGWKAFKYLLFPYKTPSPIGPYNLWEEKLKKSQSNFLTETFLCTTSCVPSTSTSAPFHVLLGSIVSDPAEIRLHWTFLLWLKALYVHPSVPEQLPDQDFHPFRFCYSEISSCFFAKFFPGKIVRGMF